jgi:hypothetical protein
MGSLIEINDTLKITTEQGMPEIIELGKRYSFSLPDERLFHRPPVRVFLVHEINGYWKYIGHVHIVEQTINADSRSTNGFFEVIKLYDSDYAKIVSINEAPQGKSYF